MNLANNGIQEWLNDVIVCVFVFLKISQIIMENAARTVDVISQK